MVVVVWRRRAHCCVQGMRMHGFLWSHRRCGSINAFALHCDQTIHCFVNRILLRCALQNTLFRCSHVAMALCNAVSWTPAFFWYFLVFYCTPGILQPCCLPFVQFWHSEYCHGRLELHRNWIRNWIVFIGSLRFSGTNHIHLPEYMMMIDGMGLAFEWDSNIRL